MYIRGYSWCISMLLHIPYVLAYRPSWIIPQILYELQQHLAKRNSTYGQYLIPAVLFSVSSFTFLYCFIGTPPMESKQTFARIMFRIDKGSTCPLPKEQISSCLEQEGALPKLKNVLYSIKITTTYCHLNLLLLYTHLSLN